MRSEMLLLPATKVRKLSTLMLASNSIGSIGAKAIAAGIVGNGNGLASLDTMNMELVSLGQYIHSDSDF